MSKCMTPHPKRMTLFRQVQPAGESAGECGVRAQNEPGFCVCQHINSERASLLRPTPQARVQWAGWLRVGEM